MADLAPLGPKENRTEDAPLVLYWAVMIHKLQGTTLDRAVVDLSSQVLLCSPESCENTCWVSDQ